MADLAFAMSVTDPDAVCVLEHAGICWPYKSTVRARQMAKRVGAAGIWRIKPRHSV